MWIDYDFLRDALLYNEGSLKPADPYAFVLVETNAHSLKEGLVAWYPFDGDLKDKSGNGNDGLATGSTGLSADRTGQRASNALQFGGAAAPGTMVVKNSQSLQFYEDMSVSFWVNIRSKSGLNWNEQLTTDSAKMNFFTKSPVTKGVMPVRDNFSGLVSFFEFKGKPSYCGIKNKIWSQVVNYSQDLFIEYCNNADSTFPSGWFHITQVYRRFGESELWVNNQLFMHSQFVNVNFSTANQYDLIFSNTFPLHGELDDIRIYNKALTPAQISSLARE